MMYVLLPAIAVSVYAGNVLGCLVLCETIPELRKAKKYVWQVPIVNVYFIMSVLFSPSRKHRFKFLWQYLQTPCKNIVATCAVDEAAKKLAAERKRSNKPQSNSQSARRVFKDSIEGCGSAVLKNYYI